MHVIDECTVQLKAGNGGNGIVAWRREAHNPYGGPYGGDGGKGGDVILVGDINTNTLMPLRNRKIIQAQDGENGRTKLQFGKNGNDYLVKVPLGTVAFHASTGEKICEILHDNEQYVICKGGLGGHGNAHFKNPQNKIPNLHENGEITKVLDVKLVIKYMADVGFVGLPNAGKSTLTCALTSAKPKVANYQFTTLQPVLGVCTFNNEKLVFADIPGLIEGASIGKGLGHEFLKHIERCNVLIHLISLNPVDHEDIIEAYETIRNELKVYKEELLHKPIIVVANKIDAPGSEKQLSKLKKHLKDDSILTVSAINQTNLDLLLEEVFNLYKKEQQRLQSLKETKKPVKVIELRKEVDYAADLVIEQVDDHIYRATCPYLEYWSNRIPLDTNDNIMRHNMKLKNIGVEEKVKKLGGKVGDTLLIYGNELTIE